tara:strand:- start:479 stop:652 length:174 start_codon:yes stop_codon:yes gene_type:complete
MTFQELLETVQGFNEEQLKKNVVVYSVDDKDFYDAEFQEIQTASDKLNDENAAYLVI